MKLPSPPAAAAVFTLLASLASHGAQPFRIEVVDKENGWPVPLVELVTTNDLKFVTDNAGVVAFDAAEYMNRETWIGVFSHGYELKPDGFGYRGVRVTPKPGGKHRIEIERRQIAKRLGRLTGAGIFAESQKLGEFASWRESGVTGSDTVQLATYQGKLVWLWGDTNLPHYPLGIFDTPVATTALKPLLSLKPPTGIVYDYVRNERGVPRGTIPIPGHGPVWISGFTTLPDAKGREHLVATYAKITEPLKPGEIGLAEWNDRTEKFDPVMTLWKKSDKEPEPPKLYPDGHPAFRTDAKGTRWLYFNGPPNFKCPATYEAWRDRSQWRAVDNPRSFKAAGGGGNVDVASASIAWSDFRKRWIMVLQQKFGTSVFGEIWYLEGESPEGPWGPAVKVATHRNYTFYNVRIDEPLADSSGPVLLFEGTYTTTFTDNKVKTPRYDYNQMLYRIDLDDPALKPAQGDF